MSLDTALYTQLTGSSAVAALVGDRVYADQAPQRPTTPYMTYRAVSGEHLFGVGGAIGLVRERVQLDVWSTSSVERRSIVEAIRNLVDGFKGAFGTENLSVRYIELEGPRHVYDPPSDASSLGLYRATVDLRIVYAESIPDHT